MTDLISREAVKEEMIKYGFSAPDMTVTEFVQDCLPSVKAVPIEVLQDIKQTLKNMTDEANGDYDEGYNFGLMRAAQIVDRKIKEV